MRHCAMTQWWPRSNGWPSRATRPASRWRRQRYSICGEPSPQPLALWERGNTNPSPAAAGEGLGEGAASDGEDSMRVLVIGSGAREHTLCWALSRSPKLSQLYCAPGNGGTAAIADNIALDPMDFAACADWAERHAID